MADDEVLVVVDGDHRRDAGTPVAEVEGSGTVGVCEGCGRPGCAEVDRQASGICVHASYRTQTGGHA
jgi:hypothetical protein